MILGADWVVPVDGPPIADGRVEIAEGRIVRLGQGGPADESFRSSLILPGLVNAHSHLEYARMSGFGDGKPFTPWIEEHIRRKAALDHPADSLVQAIDGARACLAGGITTIADCSYAGTVADAAVATGLRAIVYVEGFSDWPNLAERGGGDARPPARLAPGHPRRLATRALHGHPEDYELLIGIARRRGLPVATHILESQRETLHLDHFRDLLGADTVLIHGVFLSPEDIATAAELDLPVIHCPRSNALLGCGVAPLAELLDAGIRVGLGTDSPASAMVFDMWEEMRFATHDRPSPSRQRRGAERRRGARPGHSRGGPRDRPRRPGGDARRGDGRRPDGARPDRVALPALGRSGGRGGLRRHTQSGCNQLGERGDTL